MNHGSYVCISAPLEISMFADHFEALQEELNPLEKILWRGRTKRNWKPIIGIVVVIVLSAGFNALYAFHELSFLPHAKNWRIETFVLLVAWNLIALFVFFLLIRSILLRSSVVVTDSRLIKLSSVFECLTPTIEILMVTDISHLDLITLNSDASGEVSIKSPKGESTLNIWKVERFYETVLELREQSFGFSLPQSSAAIDIN
jgi:hypothetical protein